MDDHAENMSSASMEFGRYRNALISCKSIDQLARCVAKVYVAFAFVAMPHGNVRYALERFPLAITLKGDRAISNHVSRCFTHHLLES